MSAILSAPVDSLSIRPWPDKVIDHLGHDPRSSYVEQFWLGVLGPSTTWLLRRLVTGLEGAPDGFDLPLHDTARAIGLGGKGGRHSPFMRSLTRLVQFELAQPHGTSLLVRRKVPPLNRRQVLRLPPSLQAEHAALLRAELERPPFEQVRRRARQLALSMLEVGEEMESAERHLLRWGYHPALAREAAVWAWQRHRQALAAARDMAAAAANGIVTSGPPAGEAGGGAARAGGRVLGGSVMGGPVAGGTPGGGPPGAEAAAAVAPGGPLGGGALTGTHRAPPAGSPAGLAAGAGTTPDHAAAGRPGAVEGIDAA